MKLPRHIARVSVASASILLLVGCASAPTLDTTATPTPPAVDVTGTRVVTPGQPGSSLLGSPTDSGVLINTLASAGMELVVNYGDEPDALVNQTVLQESNDGSPIVTQLQGLAANSTYYYSVATSTGDAFAAGPTQAFHTSRDEGVAFSFGVQGDSHPERDGKMFDSALYQQNLAHASAADLDFYIMMGDDFSIEKLIEDGSVSQETVNERYVLQRGYLDTLGAQTPIYTVNGNHEQAAKYLLDGTTSNPAVYAGVARNTYFPLPTPGDFYTGDTTEVEGVGLLRDYYSFTWGDALFIVIDPYWHSDTAVDNSAADSPDDGTTEGTTKSGGKKKDGESTPTVKGKGKKQSTDGAATRDLWNNTLGLDQYNWLVDTLASSTSTYTFVFTHHVLGTGRGGIEGASLYEWGGYDKKGEYLFPSKRPDWEAPIQALMADYGVTIFFQGHDHLYAQQELDGVVYQTVPCPADPTFTAFNASAYTSGTILPNSGFLEVSVAPDGVTVDYIANGGSNDGSVVASYTIPAAAR